MTTLAVQINDANARILESYTKHRNISVTECINELIAGLHQKEQSAYLSMLAQSEDDLHDGRIVTKTFAELEALEHE